VADLSHRLRTPLAALQLEADAIEPAERREVLQDRIDRVTGELTAVITEMRRPRDAAAPDPSDLDEVVRARLDFWAALAEDQGREWSYDGPSRPVRVALGAEELAAAVDAVLGNVFTHTPDGTVFRVEVHDGKDAVLVVEDDGPGIPEELRDQVFGRFVRGSGPADQAPGGGTGLGLAIVRSVAGAHGGSVEAGSAESGGARLTVRMPLGERSERPETARV
jgi:signal transduction histidine kinase